MRFKVMTVCLLVASRALEAQTDPNVTENPVQIAPAPVIEPNEHQSFTVSFTANSNGEIEIHEQPLLPEINDA